MDHQLFSSSIFTRATVYYLLLILLLSLESLLVQEHALAYQSSFKYITGRFIFNVAVATLVLILPYFITAIIACIQTFASLFILIYSNIFTEPPFISVIYNNYYLLEETGVSPLSYVNSLVFILFILYTALKTKFIITLCRINFRIRITGGCIGLIIFCVIILNQIHSGKFQIDDPVYFENNLLPHVKRRGVSFVWIQEVMHGEITKKQAIFQEQSCSGDAVQNLPLADIEPRIVVMQVESLDYAAINAEENGQPVAPFLRELSGQSFVWEMEGKKRIASANSDYEILNGKIAREDILYYAHIINYPDSLPMLCRQKGLNTSVFHGLQGKYMNLETAYQRMGFKHLYFADVLEERGFQRNLQFFMSHIPDAALLQAAAQHVDSDEPFFHFIITLTMHGEESLLMPGQSKKPGYYDTVRYFDNALSRYVAALPLGTLLIIYGDHQSYSGPVRSGSVPFIVHKKGSHLDTESKQMRIYTRCEMFYYLRRMILHAVENHQSENGPNATLNEK